MDLFITNMQLFTSQDIQLKDWSHVDYIVAFLLAVCTPILTAPIHFKGSTGEQVLLNFSKSVLMKKNTYILDGLKVNPFIFIYVFKQMFIFGCTIPLSAQILSEATGHIHI